MKTNSEIICDAELVSRYYDKDLAPEEYSGVEAHINSCEKCRKQLSEYTDLTGKIKYTVNEAVEHDTLKVQNRIIEAIKRKQRPWWARLAEHIFTKKVLVPAVMTASIAIFVTTFYTDNPDQGPGAIITSLSSSERVVIMHSEITHQPIILVSENG